MQFNKKEFIEIMKPDTYLLYERLLTVKMRIITYVKYYMQATSAVFLIYLLTNLEL